MRRFQTIAFLIAWRLTAISLAASDWEIHSLLRVAILDKPSFTPVGIDFATIETIISRILERPHPSHHPKQRQLIGRRRKRTLQCLPARSYCIVLRLSPLYGNTHH